MSQHLCYTIVDSVKHFILLYITLTTIHLAVALDLLSRLSLNPFNALIKRNMHAYCTIKILMPNTNHKVNVLQNTTDLLIIPFK